MTRPARPPSAMAPGPPDRPSRRSRRRWGRRLLVALLVLVALFVAVDRVCLLIANRMAAETLQSSQNLQQRPEVSIGGFPFLTQLAAGSFQDIEVDAADLPVGGEHPVTLSRLRMTLHGVTVSDSFHRATSRSTTATALLSYAELSRVLNLALSYDGSGRVVARATVTVGGAPVTGRISALPVLADAELRFTQLHASVQGVGVPGADAALAAVLDHAIDLSGLPFGLHVRALAAGVQGVSVTLTAANLTLQR